MKKSELRQIIREVLREELSTKYKKYKKLKEALSRCTNCGCESEELTANAFGEKLCDDCWDNFINSERGLVDAYEQIAAGETFLLDASADPYAKEEEIAKAWNKYRKELVYPAAKCEKIEAKYEKEVTDYLFGEGWNE